ncbi:hypothetical protein [Dactylosporangium sp. NPDC051484]|uniref:hypothetical protein n=1 Tax=Dactylosporangium sp. NPDC051484 TaxID=3154942 RepID=UPI003450934A
MVAAERAACPQAWWRSGWLGERRGIKRCTDRAEPGASPRVVRPGRVSAGDEVRMVFTPVHGC